jgi:phosphatidylinositol alpha-mannosyltransferase
MPQPEPRTLRKSLKIGFVLDDSLDSTDGVQQYVLTMSEWLRNHGHDVHYLVGQTRRTDLAGLHSLSRNMSVRFNGNRMSMPLPASTARIRELLAREQFDVLHIQMPYSPFLGAKILQAAPATTALVGTFHILPFGRLHKVAARALSRYVRASQRRLDEVFSVSAPAQVFSGWLGIPSKVLPNVVAFSEFAHAKPMLTYKKDFTVVFLGRLVTRKGGMELLKAVKLLAEPAAIPNLKVVICGKGALGDKMKAWVRTHNLGGIVEFVGYVSEDDKPDYLASADVAVFPSLGGESFGIVLLEAMAAGAGVVIGGDNPGYRSVLGEGSPALFNPKDTAGLAELIQNIHDDTPLAHKLHNAQAHLVKGYDVDVVAPKLLARYQALVAKRAPKPDNET